MNTIKESFSLSGIRHQLGPWIFISISGGLIAFAFRLLAAKDAFWLDEIFSYYLAMEFDSFLEAILFTKVEHHILNTLYMHGMGEQENWLIYRLLSVISGSLSVILLWYHAVKRSGKPAALAALLLSGFSCILIVYASEARGYTPAIFFILCASLLYEAKPARRISFGICTILALLSHPSAVCIYIGLGAWGLYKLFCSEERFSNKVLDLWKWHGLPTMFFVWFYLCILRPSGSVGGDVLPLHNVLIETLTWLAGTPGYGVWPWIAVAWVVAGFIMGIYVAYIRRDGSWIFYGTTLLLAPLLMLSMQPHPYVYPRYFVVLFPFYLLMLAECLGWLWLHVQGGKFLYTFILILMLLGQGMLLIEFLAHGRGGYTQAVHHMIENTPKSVVLVGSDHDFRVSVHNGAFYLFS